LNNAKITVSVIGNEKFNTSVLAQKTSVEL